MRLLKKVRGKKRQAWMNPYLSLYYFPYFGGRTERVLAEGVPFGGYGPGPVKSS